MTSCNDALQRLGDKLNAEAEARTAEAVKLYRQCSEETQRTIASSIGMNYSTDDAYVQDYFDTLDLLDELEFLVDRIRTNLNGDTANAEAH